jgi:hypothetical protein
MTQSLLLLKRRVINDFPPHHSYSLTKAKVWERYGKVWAIYDPYVGMIWDSIDIIWDWYGV